jgi:hypothetical protein
MEISIQMATILDFRKAKQKAILSCIQPDTILFSEKARMKYGLAASSVAGQTMQLVGAEDAFTVSS